MHERVRKFAAMSEDEKRSGFEININNSSEEYIGWCGSYRIDHEYRISQDGDKCGIGICIPDRSVRQKGYAYSAMCLFMDYLFSHGETDIYTQTWSGNIRMIGLARKLGFEELKRIPDLRTVRGEKYDGLTYRLNRKAYEEAKQNT